MRYPEMEIVDYESVAQYLCLGGGANEQRLFLGLGGDDASLGIDRHRLRWQKIYEHKCKTDTMHEWINK